MSLNSIKVRSALTLKPVTAPTSPENGDIYYDSGSNTFQFRQNGSFITFATTTLNNVASTAFSADLIPANSGLNIGSTSIPVGHVYSQNFMNPIASSNLAMNTATISSGAAASGALSITTGNIDTGTSGNISLTTGGSAGVSGNSGNITISSGNATGGTSGTSGNINLTIGNATTTNGSINMSGGYLRLPRLANDPTGVTGAIYYNTGSNTIRWFNGTAWASLA